jgi:hypothetical protein
LEVSGKLHAPAAAEPIFTIWRRGSSKFSNLPGLELRLLGHLVRSQSLYRLRYSIPKTRIAQAVYTYIYIYIYIYRERERERERENRLCGLVCIVLGYRSGSPGSIPGTTRFSEKKKEKNKRKQ